MSKKTRKKSSKPPQKPQGVRRKPAAAKLQQHGKTARLQQDGIGQKACRQGRQQGSQNRHQDDRQETGTDGQNHVSQSVAQADIETVNKIRSPRRS